MKAERRSGTATMLFSDLVGSTELLASLGEAAFDEFRRSHFSVLRRVVEAHGGEEVKTLGDGIMAVFSSAADALHAAVAMQQAVDRQARRESRPSTIRIGLALGDVAFEENDVFGGPVVEAARLAAVARGGQILATAVVRLVAGGRGTVSFADLGPMALKGLPEPVPVCEVTWEPLPEPSVPLPALLSETGRMIFVGREVELERLQRLWKHLPEGAVQIALLAGEPGVGKTRLAAELAVQVHAEGNLVLAGRCDEDLGVPFQPFVEGLRHFVDHTPHDELSRHLGRFPGELARLVPELAERLPGLPVPLQADPETERYRLFDAVASWLASTSRVTPVLLILDDLQWAAKPTLLLFRHVLHSPGDGRVLMLGTYRDTDLHHDHPLVALLADLRRRDGVERFSLAGLDETGVAKFMAQAAGDALDDQGLVLAQAIHEETEGNPFFVREVLRHLAETGAIERRAGGWVVGRALDDVGIPEGVREVVGRRLARLSVDTNRALQTAAVLGAEFELPVLSAALAFEPEALPDALEAAVAARLVVDVPSRVPRYRFCHALVRETLYDGLTAARRVPAHRRAAAAIETVHAARLDDHLPALAHHWARAASPGADARKALSYATRAGHRALAQLGHDEAARYFQQGLDVLDAFGTPEDLGWRTELLIGLGEAQRRAGDAAYRETLLEAARLARAQGDGDALARASLANARGFTWSTSGGVDAARVEQLEAALEAKPEEGPIRARLLASLALELVYADDPGRRRRLSDEALAVARRLDDPAVLSAVLLSRFVTIWDPSTLAERRSNADETLTVAERLGDPVTKAWAYYRASIAAMEAGAGDEGERLRHRFEELLSEELGQPTLRWIAVLNRTTARLMQGRIEEAERLAFSGLEIGRGAAQADADLWFDVHLFNIRFDQGRLQEIEARFAEVVGQYPRIAALQSLLALLHCESGRPTEARRVFDQLAAHDFADIPLDVTWLSALVAAAAVANHLDDQSLSETLYRFLGPYADHIASPPHFCLGSVAHYLGLLATTLGRLEEADAHFAAAEEAQLRMHAQTWTARTRMEWARMLLLQGERRDAGRIHGLLTQALDTARSVGLGLVERGAAKLLNEHTGRPSDVPIREV